jgi:hypothetical protein
MAMERVWTDIAKPDPNPSASPCPTHESIHGHGCRSKSKPTRYLDIHEYPWIYTMYIIIIMLDHFGLLTIIVGQWRRGGVVDTVVVALTS